MIWMLLQPEIVELEAAVSNRDNGRATVVILEDEQAIRKVVLGMDREAVSVDVVENRIFVKLLREASGTVDLIAGSGRLYRLKIRPSRLEVADIVRVRTARPGPTDNLSQGLELLRLMAVGGEPEEGSRAALEGEILRAGGIRLCARELYRWKGWIGVVCVLENRSDRDRKVDCRRFRGRGLRVAAARNLIVPAGGSTEVFLVFEEDAP